MTTFIVLYHAPVATDAQPVTPNPEQLQAGMDAWTSWAENAGDALVDLGLPLVSRAVHGDGATASATISGYSILQAESLDALNALLDGHPHLSVPGATLEVLEGLPMMGAELNEGDVSPVEDDLDEDEDDDGDEDDDDAVADDLADTDEDDDAADDDAADDEADGDEADGDEAHGDEAHDDEAPAAAPAEEAQVDEPVAAE